MQPTKGPSYVAVITGISGREGFLSGHGWAFDIADAKVFTNPTIAQREAEGHIKSYPTVLQRHMSARVERRA
jgi:hypothetical protein